MGRHREPAKPVPLVASPQVGSSIDASCSKCRRVTSHVIVRKLGFKPTWVDCSVCSEGHPFRLPARAGRAVRRLPAPTTPEDAWKNAMSGSRGPLLAYSTCQSYRVGQQLTHPSFGNGVVIRLASPTVCEVFFSEGEKKLLMGTTTRP